MISWVNSWNAVDMTTTNQPLQWRHNGRDSVSNHQPHDCLLNLYSDADQRKHQSSASLAFVRWVHRRPVNSPHKWPVTQKMFPFDDVIMHNKNLAHILWNILYIIAMPYKWWDPQFRRPIAIFIELAYDQFSMKSSYFWRSVRQSHSFHPKERQWGRQGYNDTTPSCFWQWNWEWGMGNRL